MRLEYASTGSRVNRTSRRGRGRPIPGATTQGLRQVSRAGELFSAMIKYMDLTLDDDMKQL
jgi:hypothetical protein